MEQTYVSINEQNTTDLISDSDSNPIAPNPLAGSNPTKVSFNENGNLSLEAEIHDYIYQNFPDYYHTNITDYKKAKIEYMTNLFGEFDDIKNDKHKHNLKWALKKASDEFAYDQLKKAHPKTDCFGAFDEVVISLRKDSKSKINKMSRRFSLLSSAVSFLDIIVSVALILIVTILSHLGDKIFDTVLISTLFIGVVALTKVTVDRFAIMPLIDRYGWKMFNKSITQARQESIKINAIYCVLMESITRKESIETRYNIIASQNNKNNIISNGKIFSEIKPQPSISD